MNKLTLTAVILAIAALLYFCRFNIGDQSDYKAQRDSLQTVINKREAAILLLNDSIAQINDSIAVKLQAAQVHETKIKYIYLKYEADKHISDTLRIDSLANRLRARLNALDFNN